MSGFSGFHQMENNHPQRSYSTGKAHSDKPGLGAEDPGHFPRVSREGPAHGDSDVLGSSASSESVSSTRMQTPGLSRETNVGLASSWEG